MNTKLTLELVKVDGRNFIVEPESQDRQLWN